MSLPPPPPAHVARYCDILGYDLTVDFILHFGGAELYIPANSKGRGELAKFLGVEMADALAAQAHRLPTRVPTAKPWLAEVFRFRGWSVPMIARKLHVSDVAVRRWFKAAEAERFRKAQPGLI